MLGRLSLDGHWMGIRGQEELSQPRRIKPPADHWTGGVAPKKRLHHSV